MNRKKIIGLVGVWLVFIVNLALAYWLTSDEGPVFLGVLIHLGFIYCTEALCIGIPCMAVLESATGD